MADFYKFLGKYGKTKKYDVVAKKRITQDNRACPCVCVCVGLCS